MYDFEIIVPIQFNISIYWNRLYIKMYNFENYNKKNSTIN